MQQTMWQHSDVVASTVAIAYPASCPKTARICSSPPVTFNLISKREWMDRCGFDPKPLCNLTSYKNSHNSVTICMLSCLKVNARKKKVNTTAHFMNFRPKETFL